MKISPSISVLRSLMLGLTLAAMGAAAVDPAPGARVSVIGQSGFAGSSINVLANLQHTVFSDAGVQYAGYYDAEGHLVLARRAVETDDWEIRRTEYRANVADAHNTVALVIDGAGYLHVAWDHHGNPLNYAKSVRPGSLELGPRQPMTGQRETRVTYPAFLRMPNGDLLFLFRDGASGRGNLALHRYHLAEERWEPVHGSLIDGEGRRSAYTSALVDAHGVLHLAWNWRESPDVATNHDLCYARSADGGVTWMTTAGDPLELPLNLERAEYALRIPQDRALMNPPSLGVDEAGHPYLTNYWRPEGSEIPQYHLVHHDGTAWHTTQISQRTTPFELRGANTKRPPLSRSVVLARRSGGRQEVWVVYRDDDQGGRVILARCADLRSAGSVWSFQPLTTGSIGAWEPSIDPVPWKERGEIHLLVQKVEQRDGNDRDAAAVAPTPVGILVWPAR